MCPSPSSNVSTDASPRAEEVALQMAEAWRDGDRRPAESFLDRLGPTPPTADLVRVIYEEFCLRLELGVPAQVADFSRRFPNLSADLDLLFGCHALIYPEVGNPRLPEEGDHLAGFDLARELGRGASGRVFVATDPSLDDREVVLKITPLRGAEHRSLARLLHTHIVPIHSVHELPEPGLRVICMPFLGGATLNELFEAMPAADRSGRDLLEALDRVGTRAVASPPKSPARSFLAQATREETICWIGSCLAEALGYIHDRGLVHFDLKPSNVLITAEGQPLLLDFHLAGPPLHPGDPSPSQFGGTAHYMSPEQEVGCAAFREGRTVPRLLDGRSDIFSLGLVLREMAAGDGHTTLSPGLRSILRKCLQPRPDDRYLDPNALAIDLRRHAADLPLRTARNPSLTERYRKWRRRHPNYSWVAVGGAALLAGSLLAATAVADRVRLAFSKLDEATLLLSDHEHAEAMRAASEGLDSIRSFPWCGRIRSDLNDLGDRARLGLVAAEVARAANLTRLYHDERSLDRADAAALLAPLDRLMRRADDEFVSLDRDRRLRGDLLDIAIFTALIRSRLAPVPAIDAVDRELAEAEGRFGEDLVVAAERRRLRDPDPTLWPNWSSLRASARSNRECLGLGRILLVAGRHQEAADLLRRAVADHQDDPWLHFLLGHCHRTSENFEEAIGEYSAYIALSPDTPDGYINRSLCFARLGRHEAARRDSEHARRWSRSEVIR